MSQRRSCDRDLTVCSLFWLGLVASAELEEEVAHDHDDIYMLGNQRSELFVIY